MNQVLNIQEITDNTLYRIITEGSEIKWNLFALNVMISRLRLKIKMTKNQEQAISECIKDLRDLLRRSSSIPNAKKDFQIIENLFTNVN